MTVAKLILYFIVASIVFIIGRSIVGKNNWSNGSYYTGIAVMFFLEIADTIYQIIISGGL